MLVAAYISQTLTAGRSLQSQKWQLIGMG